MPYESRTSGEPNARHRGAFWCERSLRVESRLRIACVDHPPIIGVMDDGPFPTNVPARLDRLRWSSFHSSLIAALGTSWIIDGLEVTLVGSLGSVLTLPTALALTPSEVGEVAGAYVVGAVMGAVLFGGLADRYGRRRLFFVTLGVYAAATIASGLAPNYPFFLAMRFLTGAGVGGEYAAINSAIQEFMPARLRGRVDLAVNGSFWVGAA